MLDETWKPIKYYEGLYEVSNLGNVRSLDRAVPHSNGMYLRVVKGTTLSLFDSGRGYLSVRLSKNGKKRNKLVHRLVAEAFIDNPLNKPQVNHINEVRWDNNVNNLEWTTSKENNNHGSRTLKASNSTKKKIKATSIDGLDVRVYNGAIEAEQLDGFSYKQISLCCTGRHKTHKGFRWEFI
ncbi:NUMOD4 motif family protein [Enterococcus phage Entf1]|nr:NUMOD4 motif family protein [Enterococcus phage Entf1]